MFPQVNRSGGAQLSKAQKWVDMLPGMLDVIAHKQSLGWDVAFIDGSKDVSRELLCGT